MDERITSAELARFQSKYRREGDCLIWTDSLDRDGYGSFFFRGASRRAHRMAWYLANGEIAEGLVVNHTCRNRACVSHQHLQLVTARENTLKDSRSAGYINSQKTTCPKGHPYDKTVTWAGKTQRLCSICYNAKNAAGVRRRREAGKRALRI